jgi:hypothetical protein
MAMHFPAISQRAVSARPTRWFLLLVHLPNSYVRLPPSLSYRPTQAGQPRTLSQGLGSPLEHDAYTPRRTIDELARRRAEAQPASAPQHRTIMITVFEDSQQSCCMVQQVRWVRYLAGSGSWFCWTMVATMCKHPRTISTQHS